MLFEGRLLLSIERQENEDAKSLIQSKKLHKKRDAAGNTLLHYAVEYGNREIVQFLVEAGSAVDAKNKLGQTPLLKSVESDSPYIEVIKILLDARAHLNDEEDADDERVLDTINSSEWLNKDAGRFEILKTIIEQADSWLHSMSDVTILRYGNKEDIESLLQTNVDLSADDSFGQSLIHILAMNSNPGVIQLLHGRNFDVNESDCDGATPLLNAVFEPTPSSLEFFLKNGADIRGVFYRTGDKTDLYDILDFISEHRGLSNRHKDIVQPLLEHGVKPHCDARDEDSSLFSDLWRDVDNDIAKTVVAHMALQEALGTAVTDVDRRRINRHEELYSYFERCQLQLRNEAICPTVTMFDALTASERKLERLFRNQELASKLSDFKTSTEYFNTRLRKQFEKANRMVKLRKTVTGVVSELMEMDYDMYPDVIDEVISYLSEEDIDRVAKVN